MFTTNGVKTRECMIAKKIVLKKEGSVFYNCVKIKLEFIKSSVIV